MTFHKFLDGDSERPWTVLFTHPKDSQVLAVTSASALALALALALASKSSMVALDYTVSA